MNLKAVNVILITLTLSLSAFAQDAVVSDELGAAEDAQKSKNISEIKKKIAELKSEAREVGYRDAYLLIDEVSLARKGGERPDESIDHLLGKQARLDMITEKGKHLAQATLILNTFKGKDIMCQGALRDLIEDELGSTFGHSAATAARSIGSSASELQAWAALNKLARRTAGKVQSLEDDVVKYCQ